MNDFKGQVSELRLEADGAMRAVIACPANSRPAPGQYLQAHSPADEHEALPVSLFLAENWGATESEEQASFMAAPPIPSSWRPSTQLHLRGPLGRGFQPPGTSKKLALVALGKSVARLMPLAQSAINDGLEVALFSDASLPKLPTQVEANPLNALADATRWADFLALDCPLENYEDVLQQLGLVPNLPLPCPAQILLYAPMPCGGLAECGVCALTKKGRGWRLVCAEGPVFKFSISRGQPALESL